MTPTEQAIQKIEDHVKDAELGSARFQAFFDFTDRVSTETALLNWPHNDIISKMEPQLEYSLINETIRQRKMEFQVTKVNLKMLKN